MRSNIALTSFRIEMRLFRLLLLFCPKMKVKMSPRSTAKNKIRFVLMQVHWTTDCQPHNENVRHKTFIEGTNERDKQFILFTILRRRCHRTHMPKVHCTHADTQTLTRMHTNTDINAILFCTEWTPAHSSFASPFRDSVRSRTNRAVENRSRIVHTPTLSHNPHTLERSQKCQSLFYFLRFFGNYVLQREVAVSEQRSTYRETSLCRNKTRLTCAEYICMSCLSFR